MTRIRKHLTYANVVSTIFVFLLLAGGTAIAAKQLGKKTVGTKQLKSNAVTTAKIKKGAVTNKKIAANAIDNSKIADNAVTGSKIADGSVTGGDINAGSTSFSQITARMRTNSVAPFSGPTAVTVGSYTQNPGEDNVLLASVDAQFAATCAPPRVAVAELLIDTANPLSPKAEDLLGYALIEDKLGGESTRRRDFGPFPGLASSFTRVGPLAPTTHTFTVVLLGSSCSSGSGVNFVGAGVDVIGTK